MVNRILSAIVALIYLIAAYRLGGAGGVIRCIAFLVLPLACIWFSKEMESYTGIMRLQSVDTESPGCLVIACGWLLMLLPLIVGLIWHFQGN
ncbi:MAG: hypothetical protein C4520_13090 [Candidatus Abyssobacteria bacterium SURF_5]|uniref:Uncharacterized protein n=1 Tax=Abyssobacteria bacterium (strain SURF_5) TaxID=2093360 RepID=A0A3A4NJP4_ABYX5|nr:MAG: hypothetical protein C4520_13090 [Candidatus Abyssubacteria bacterium SURF_5]